MDPDRQSARQSHDDLCWLTIPQAALGLRARQFSSMELTDAFLDRIAQFDTTLNTHITVTADSARADAARADERLGRGAERGPLDGIPIGLKDMIDTAGIRTTGGSRILRDRIPGRDATVVRRLRQAGVVILGKHALHEFATGSARNPTFGATHNPWAVDRVTGGSSSGSAAAVAAGFALAAIGTDTGGSVRLPAALCGVVGIRPAPGALPLGGVLGLSASFDTVGPLARTVDGAATLLAAMGRGGTALAVGAWLNRPHNELRPAQRIAVPGGAPWRDVDASVQAALEAALEKLTALGAVIEPIELGGVSVAVDARRTIAYAEAYRLHATRLADRRDEYDPSALALLDFGRSVTPAAEASARAEVRRFGARVRRLLGPGRLLATPTTPAAAWRFDDRATIGGIPINVAALRMNAVTIAAGMAAMSLPCGAESDGRPIGLQLACLPGDEPRMLAAARAYEQSTEWWKRRPTLTPLPALPPR